MRANVALTDEVCFTQANVVHFVENRTGGGGGIHVNLTWHSATDVEDVIVDWEQSDEATVSKL